MPVRNTSADAVLTTQVESEFKRQDPAPFFGILRFNSLAPGRFQINFRQVIFKLTLVNGGWGISYEISLRWMPLCLIVDKSTLVQVMAWCRRATSHFLSQCWPRFMSPNGVTRPQWVNETSCVILHSTGGEKICSNPNHILTHCSRVTHICASTLPIIGSANGLSPGQRQAIIWTSDEILLIGPLGTNFSEILIEIYIHVFSFKKMHLKLSSGNWRPFCLGLNVLIRLSCENPSKRRLYQDWAISFFEISEAKFLYLTLQTPVL